jgi:hypothetical protein
VDQAPGGYPVVDIGFGWAPSTRGIESGARPCARQTWLPLLYQRLSRAPVGRRVVGQGDDVVAPAGAGVVVVAAESDVVPDVVELVVVLDVVDVGLVVDVVVVGDGVVVVVLGGGVDVVVLVGGVVVVLVVLVVVVLVGDVVVDEEDDRGAVLEDVAAGWDCVVAAAGATGVGAGGGDAGWRAGSAGTVPVASGSGCTPSR